MDDIFQTITKPQPTAEPPVIRLRWFALKVFYNRMRVIVPRLQEAGYEVYIPEQEVEVEKGGKMVTVKKQIIQSLLFVKTNKLFLRKFRIENWEFCSYYRRPGDWTPAAIKDHEMLRFIAATTINGGRDVRPVDPNTVHYREGDWVRVVKGPYAGLEGYIKRVKKNRLLFIEIKGVCVVAINKVLPDQCEKIEREPEDEGLVLQDDQEAVETPGTALPATPSADHVPEEVDYSAMSTEEVERQIAILTAAQNTKAAGEPGKPRKLRGRRSAKAVDAGEGKTAKAGTCAKTTHPASS